MFPTPIEKTSAPLRALYKVALTSVRGQADLMAGNYWSLPTQWRIAENYQAVSSSCSRNTASPA